MPNCPVCDAEYTEGQDRCITCRWDLTPLPTDAEASSLYGTKLKMLQMVQWARNIWLLLHQERLHPEEAVAQTEQQRSPITSPEEGSPLEQIPEEASPTHDSATLLHQILVRFNSVEARLEAMEQTLKDSFQPSSPSISEKSSSKKTSENLLNYTEIQLIAAYHKNANAIAKQAAEVAVAEETFIQGSQQLVFEISRRGSYWILLEQEMNYLVPKNSIKINQYSYTTFQKVFTCHDYQEGESKSFLLLKPAVVSAILLDQKWQLVSPGIVQFIAAEENHTSPQEQESTVLQDSNTDANSFSIPEDTQAETKAPEDKPSQATYEIYLTHQEADIVTAYQRDFVTLARRAIEVSISLGDSQTVVLEKTRWGKYWLLAEKQFCYVVPREDIRIDDYNYENIQTVFICNGYKQGLSSKFHLLKPAKVSPISDHQWQLVEFGVLQLDEL